MWWFNFALLFYVAFCAVLATDTTSGLVSFLPSIGRADSLPIFAGRMTRERRSPSFRWLARLMKKTKGVRKLLPRPRKKKSPSIPRPSPIPRVPIRMPGRRPMIPPPGPRAPIPPVGR